MEKNVFDGPGIPNLRDLNLSLLDLWLKDIRSVCLACQPTSQQYCSLIINSHQPPASSQLVVLFSHNKSAPVSSIVAEGISRKA